MLGVSWVVVAACQPAAAPVPPPPSVSPLLSSSPTAAALEDAGSPVVAPRPPLDGTAVEKAYATSTFASFGACQPADAKVVANGLTADSSGARGILQNGQSCKFDGAPSSRPCGYFAVDAQGQFAQSFWDIAEGVTRVALVARGTRLVLDEEDGPAHRISLVDVPKLQTIVSYETSGQHTWIVDRDETHLFVSGILVPNSVTSFDHAEIDLSTGAVEKARTGEHPSDVPGREVAISVSGETFVAASDLRLTLFATHPFRVANVTTLPASPGGMDSSFPKVPSLVRVSDGETLLASMPSSMGGGGGGGAEGSMGSMGSMSGGENVWKVSLRSRKVAFKGTMSSERYDAMIGHPDESTDTANLDLATRLAPTLAVIDGLYVPKSVCRPK